MNKRIYSQKYCRALNKAIQIMLLFVLLGVGTSGKSCVLNRIADTPHIVFLVSEDPDNYEAHITIPEFAKYLSTRHLYKTTVLTGESNRTAYSFPNFEIIKDADLVVIFSRRLALASNQMKLLKNYLKSGGGLVGIRTANHAFTLLKGEKAAAGFEEWPEFVPKVLGCENRGYGVVTSKTEVHVRDGQTMDRILNGINGKQWLSDGNLYLVDPLLVKDAHVLLQGVSDNRTEPIAWTRLYDNSRVFYTSLGYPTDFTNQNFIKLLENAIAWTMNKDT